MRNDLWSDCTRLSFPTRRGHPLLRVSAAALAADAWCFALFFHSSAADHTVAIPRCFRNNTGSFAIPPLPGRPKMIQATPLVPIPDALVYQTCVTGNLKSPLLFSPEIKYLGQRGNHSQLSVVHAVGLACKSPFSKDQCATFCTNRVIRSKFVWNFLWLFFILIILHTQVVKRAF